MDFQEWLKYGMEQRWCGPIVCETHDGLPISYKEEEEFWENDPCINILRVYMDAEHAEQVEENHSASVWKGN